MTHRGACKHAFFVSFHNTRLPSAVKSACLPTADAVQVQRACPRKPYTNCASRRCGAPDTNPKQRSPHKQHTIRNALPARTATPAGKPREQLTHNRARLGTPTQFGAEEGPESLQTQSPLNATNASPSYRWPPRNPSPRMASGLRQLRMHCRQVRPQIHAHRKGAGQQYRATQAKRMQPNGCSGQGRFLRIDERHYPGLQREVRRCAGKHPKTRGTTTLKNAPQATTIECDMCNRMLRKLYSHSEKVGDGVMATQARL